MSQYLQPLSEISRADAGRFGGKATALGDMLQAGIPVPDGFAVSIDAQRDFTNKAFSAEFKLEIDRLFQTAKLIRVAVRSSAIAEDSSSASWAGQLESYLNVERDGVEDAIRKCWRSIKTKHAREYARDKQLDESDLLVGVVVQAMIDSEVSGVMFTVNPTTHNRDELVIEGVFGLGEMLVQGIVTPDRFIYDKQRSVVTDFTIEIKRKAMTYKNGKNQTNVLPLEVGDRATLREAEVTELAKLGMAVERYYGAPRDIEWARQDGKFYIVQARPITTL